MCLVQVLLIAPDGLGGSLCMSSSNRWCDELEKHDTTHTDRSTNFISQTDQLVCSCRDTETNPPTVLPQARTTQHCHHLVVETHTADSKRCSMCLYCSVPVTRQASTLLALTLGSRTVTRRGSGLSGACCHVPYWRPLP